MNFCFFIRTALGMLFMVLKKRAMERRQQLGLSTATCLALNYGLELCIKKDRPDGTGHHALFTDNSGRRRIVFHSHNSHGRIQPRVIHIGSYGFTPGGRLEIGDDFINPQLTQ